MIQNDSELKEIIKQINENLQLVSEYIGPEDPDKYDHNDFLIRIPRGYIRKASEHRDRISFIGDQTLIKNISYSLLLSDFYCWLLNRTGISLTLREMIIKSGITLYCSIAESLLRIDPLKNIRPNKSFKRRLEGMLNVGYIDVELKNKLSWLWDARGNIHLYILNNPEYKKYNDEDYNKAATITSELLEVLRKIKEG